MRALIPAIALMAAAATSAAAQDYSALVHARDADRFAAEQAARQRDVALANELSRLQAQVQTSQALADLAATRNQPSVVVRYSGKGPPPTLDQSKLAQIPDSVLADSNAKVRAAAGDRR